jgi:hypothetical protein
VVIVPGLLDGSHDHLLGRQSPHEPRLEVVPIAPREDEPRRQIELRIRPPESDEITDKRQKREEDGDVGPALTVRGSPIAEDLTVSPDRGRA